MYVPRDVAAIPHPKKERAPGKYTRIRVLYMGSTRGECLSSLRSIPVIYPVFSRWYIYDFPSTPVDLQIFIFN